MKTLIAFGIGPQEIITILIVVLLAFVTDLLRRGPSVDNTRVWIATGILVVVIAALIGMVGFIVDSCRNVAHEMC